MGRPKVAFQGECDAFSEQAALSFFGDDMETKPCKTLKDVFRSVQYTASQFGSAR